MTVNATADRTPESGAERNPVARLVPWLVAVTLTALGAVLVYRFDLPISRSLSQVSLWPGDSRRILALAEYVAHGSGVLAVLTVIWCLVPEKRRFLPRIAMCGLGAGATANLFKLCFARRRPLMTDPGVTDIDITWAAYARGIPVDKDKGYLDYAWQSFPSAHTATAVGLAIGLSYLFPAGRRVFWTLAVLAAMQRVVYLAHWPSDVMAGAVIGVIIGACMTLRGTLGCQLFDRLEAWAGQRSHNRQTRDAGISDVVRRAA